MEPKKITAQSVYQEVMKHMNPDERLRLAALILNDFARTVDLVDSTEAGNEPSEAGKASG